MKDKFIKGVSLELKRIRENKGYTITDVSKNTKHSANLISRYENGKSIDLLTLLSLLNFYEARVDIFFANVYTYMYNFKDPLLKKENIQ